MTPRRLLTTSKTSRWFGNLGIILLNGTVVRLGFPILPVDLALLGQKNGWGLLNNFDLPYWLAVVVGVIALDFVIYLQHVMFHAVPALWSFHMMHHADLDFDVTTGLRFHPIEIVLSTGIKLAAVVVLGPPLLGVLVNGDVLALLRFCIGMGHVEISNVEFRMWDVRCGTADVKC